MSSLLVSDENNPNKLSPQVDDPMDGENEVRRSSGPQGAPPSEQDVHDPSTAVSLIDPAILG